MGEGRPTGVATYGSCRDCSRRRGGVTRMGDGRSRPAHRCRSAAVRLGVGLGVLPDGRVVLLAGTHGAAAGQDPLTQACGDVVPPGVVTDVEALVGRGEALVSEGHRRLSAVGADVEAAGRPDPLTLLGDEVE